jgi:hypothetical protein
MTPLSRIRLLGLAGAGALAALTAANAPAYANEPLTNLGPVGPREPILVKIGNQHIIAFFIPERGECAVNAVTWKDADANAPYASVRVRVSLKPGQLVQLDGSQRQSMGLVCGADASSLGVTAPAELILALPVR